MTQSSFHVSSVIPVQLYHRTNTFEMALSLLVAGADPNIISKRGSTVFDALFRERNYISTKPPWDGCNTAFLLIKGSDRWTAQERNCFK